MKIKMLKTISKMPAPDIIEIGYPALREAFNTVLAKCQQQLTKADFSRAIKKLGIGEELTSEEAEFFVDLSFFSRPDSTRKKRERAIDRIAKKISDTSDPLIALIAERLPKARFSIFEFQSVNGNGEVELLDVISKRELRVMDNNLSMTGRPGFLFASRFIELDPWHIGFGIVVPLQKSEATALVFSLMAIDASEKEATGMDDILAEIIFASRIHELDLVREALDPLVDLMIEHIDSSPLGISTLIGKFVSDFSGVK